LPTNKIDMKGSSYSYHDNNNSRFNQPLSSHSIHNNSVHNNSVHNNNNISSIRGNTTSTHSTHNSVHNRSSFDGNIHDSNHNNRSNSDHKGHTGGSKETVEEEFHCCAIS